MFVVAVVMLFCFAVFCVLAVCNKRRPKFLYLLLALASCAVGVFIRLPPLQIPWWQVNVGYVGPAVSPDGQTACFLKIVTQEKQGYVPTWSPGPLKTQTGWHPVVRRQWAQAYLCRSKADGSNPEVLHEVYRAQLAFPVGDAVDVGFPWTHDTAGFVVSWSRKKAICVINRWHENLRIFDLDSDVVITRTIGNPESRGFADFYKVSLQCLQNDSAIFWCALGHLGILTFDGNERIIKLRDLVGDRYCSQPVWSEEQKVFVMEVRPQIWIFNSEFELLEKFSVADLAPVLHAKQQHKQPPEHKYAWVVDKLWAASLPKDSKPAGPSTAEFSLKTHTIAHKHIDPKDAALIW